MPTRNLAFARVAVSIFSGTGAAAILVALLLCSSAQAVQVGFQTITSGACGGAVIKSTPWIDASLCSVPPNGGSLQFDCTRQRITSFAGTSSCATSGTSTTRNFTCRSFNISGRPTGYGISFSCQDVPSTELFTYSEGAGNCVTRNTTTLRMTLRLGVCQSSISTTGIPSRSYLLTPLSGQNVRLSRYTNNAFCNSSASNVTLNLLQECSSGGSTYQNLVPYPTGSSVAHFRTWLVLIILSLTAAILV